jgi:5-methylcytosine-specific restriction endonuclease McrA
VECGRPAAETHHEKFRSAGVDHATANLKPLCLKCHGAKHGINIILDSQPMWSGATTKQQEGKQ